MSLVVKHKAYRTLHKENGEVFKSIEEFCAEKQPWGLGYEKEALDQIIQERLERQRRQKLEGVPEAKPGTRTDLTSAHDEPRLGRAESTTKRLRAIKDRAPAIVRQFYEDNLIGEIEAAKLGPVKPSEDRKEVIAGIVEKLEGLPVRDRTDKEKRDIKRQLNQMINQRMGTCDFKVIDDPVKAARALGKRFKGDRRHQLIDSLLSEPE